MKLTINNIGALTGTHIYEFTDGITALVGPNGCGKSTVVGALFLAATGETLTRCSFDDLISWGCETASVGLETPRCTIKRVLQRGKGQKSTFSYSEGNMKSLTRKEDIDEAIMLAFSLVDRAAFRQVYFAEQFRAIEIIDAGNAKRLEALAALLGLSRFEKFRTILNSSASTIFTQKVGKELIENLSNRLSTVTSDIRKLESALKGITVLPEEEKRRLEDLLTRPSKEKIDDVLQSNDSQKKSLESIQKRLSELPAPVTKQEIDSLHNSDRLFKLKEELEALVRYAESMNMSSPVSPSSDKLYKLLIKIHSSISAIDSKISDVKNRANLLKSGKCPITSGEPCADLVMCANPQAILSEVEKLEKDKEEHLKDEAEISELIETTKKKESDRERTISQMHEIEEEIKTLTQYESVDREALRQRVSDNESIMKEQHTLVVKEASLRSMIETTEAWLKENEFDYYPTEEEKRKATESLDADRDKINEKLLSESQLSGLKKEKEEILKSVKLVEEQNAKADKGKSAVDFLNKVRSVLHKDQLPLLLVAKMREGLNKRLSTYQRTIYRTQTA